MAKLFNIIAAFENSFVSKSKLENFKINSYIKNRLLQMTILDKLNNEKHNSNNNTALLYKKQL